MYGTLCCSNSQQNTLKFGIWMWYNVKKFKEWKYLNTVPNQTSKGRETEPV